MDQESNAVKCVLDGIEFQLRMPEDFSWLKKYGTVFQVMDRQTSGNLCFGVEGIYGKLFVKYAGAFTVNYAGHPVDAALQLMHAMPLYEKHHPALAELLAHGPVGNGYAAVFAWHEGDTLRELRGERSGRCIWNPKLFSALSMLDGVYDLHQMLAEDGYIAVDFHAGNLLVNLLEETMRVCDVDLYRKKPAVNDRGRMYGSSRFMSPEEFELHAPLTERTTVFNLGALAFEVFGDNMDRRKKAWCGPPVLFDVAARATQAKPAQRYPTVRAFLTAWREAVKYVNNEKE